MNRKSNPWVALIALMLLAAIVAVVLGSCEPEEVAAETLPDRFQVTHRQQELLGMVSVILDTQTGVEYLLIHNSNGFGLTKLEPEKDEAKS